MNGVSGKRSRHRFECKPELQMLFEFANTVPQTLEVRSIQEVLENLRSGVQVERVGWLDNEFQLFVAFSEYLNTLPQDFRAAVNSSAINESEELLKLGSFLDEDKFTSLQIEALEEKVKDYKSKAVAIFHKQIGAYETLRILSMNLRKLAEVGAIHQEYFGKKLEVIFGLTLVEYAYLDGQGLIRRTPNPMAEVLDGVEVRRIRICLVCGKLFWASRSDKKCCSSEHAVVFRKRLSRENQRQNASLYRVAAKKKSQRIHTKRNKRRIKS